MSRSSETTALAPLAHTELAETGQQQAEPPNMVKQIHTLLRGRYWLASLLAVLGLAVGGAVGYSTQEPTYESVGMIRVQPYLPRILYENDQNGVLPMFDAFVGSQVELIKGQRVVDLAMQDEEWSALGRGLEPSQVIAFRSELDVSRAKGSEIIRVSFEDRDPQAARLAVKAIIGAYERLYGEKGTNTIAETIRILEAREATLTNQLKALTDRIFEIANEQGSGALDTIYAYKLSELNKLETELRKVELEVAIARSADAQRAAEGSTPPSIGPDSVEAIALRVPEIQSLLDERRSLERQLRIDQRRLGEGHQQIIRLQAQLEGLDEEITQAVELYRELGASGGIADATGLMTAAQLEAKEKNIRTLFEAAQAETQDLGRKSVQIESLRGEANQLKTLLAETKQRLDAINVEKNLGGRINIESTGDMPLAPANDKRTQFAAAGAVGLGGLGVGLVLLMGLIDRRVHGVNDIEESGQHLRLLGVLPYLPADVSDPEQAMMAAHGVHQIRTYLQGRNNAEDKCVIAVTSPSPGSGKTSLSLALGLSFASSRTRTLLIDCDIVGGGLTAKMKHVSRRRLGHILRRQGSITTPQLIEACKIRSREGGLLGEVLIKLGYASEDEVMQALDTQRSSLVGLREAMRGDPIQECFAETGTSGLYLMPLGSASRQHVGELSYPTLLRIVDQVRRWFDVIIIDTGPILGSLEASIAIMVADEVVLTVARGETRNRVQRSIEQLTASGIPLAGVVLNRASTPDILASGYRSSISRRSDEIDEPAVEYYPEVDHKSLRLGPIGTAVAGLSAYEVEARHAG